MLGNVADPKYFEKDLFNVNVTVINLLASFEDNSLQYLYVHDGHSQENKLIQSQSKFMP